jgi:CheY-like chemotaxis protein
MSEPRRRRPPNALLVDDGTGSRKGNLSRLERSGYHVTLCADPESGLRLALEAAHDVIFLRIGREGSGSTAFIEALRAHDHTRHTPVVLLSGHRARAMSRLGLTVVESNGAW